MLGKQNSILKASCVRSNLKWGRGRDQNIREPYMWDADVLCFHLSTETGADTRCTLKGPSAIPVVLLLELPWQQRCVWEVTVDSSSWQILTGADIFTQTHKDRITCT